MSHGLPDLVGAHPGVCQCRCKPGPEVVKRLLAHVGQIAGLFEPPRALSTEGLHVSLSRRACWRPENVVVRGARRRGIVEGLSGRRDQRNRLFAVVLLLLDENKSAIEIEVFPLESSNLRGPKARIECKPENGNCPDQLARSTGPLPSLLPVVLLERSDQRLKFSFPYWGGQFVWSLWRIYLFYDFGLGPAQNGAYVSPSFVTGGWGHAAVVDEVVNVSGVDFFQLRLRRDRF